MAFINNINTRPTEWDNFHTDLTVVASNENDKRVSFGGSSANAANAELNTGVNFQNVRTMELLSIKIPNIFAPVEGDGFSINGTQITFRTGAPNNGTEWAAEVQSILIAQHDPNWLVTFDPFTRKLVFNNAVVANPTFTFANNKFGSKIAKALGFRGPTFNKDGFTGTTSTTLGAYPYSSPLIPDVSGPDTCYVNIAGFNSMQTSSSGTSFTFNVPISVPFGSIISFSQQSGFRQSVQYYYRGLNINFDQLSITIFDNYGNQYPVNGNVWTVVLGFTTWNQTSTVPH